MLGALIVSSIWICDYDQGYPYAKPMANSRVPWLLTTWAQEARSERVVEERAARRSV